MPLAGGARLGPYEILTPLGRGGMGEVYKARDTRLDRVVAIKTLPRLLADDPQFRERFDREARTISSLSHPHICGLFDVGESPDPVGGSPIRYLVIEFLEGETLEARLSRGALDQAAALQVAVQVAAALDAAHQAGVVHRDLKPGNVMLTRTGAKLLDFGLAKAGVADMALAMTQSPTVVGPTAGGTLLGTAPYMSPEQARGLPVDKRADIWAFGCVLFEMLTGARAFRGATTTDVLAAIVTREPPLDDLPAGTPRDVRRLLRRCLEKNADDRLHDIADARLELADAIRGDEDAGVATRREASWRSRLTWLAAAVVLGAAAATLLWTRRPPAIAQEMRFEVTTPTGSDPTSLAISPDGQSVVFAATSEGRPKLWLRSFAAMTASPLAGTDFGFYPFWSPDSRSIAFFAEGRLLRLDLDGGLVRMLAVAPNPAGGAWNSSGSIVFAPNFAGPLFRVPATGGDAVVQTRIEARQASHSFPRFLPDGKHFLFYVPSAPEARGIYLGDIDGGPSRRLLDADSAGVYVPPGHLLYLRDDKLIAQQFDPARFVVSGGPFSVADQVMAAVGNSGVSASSTGTIIYRVGGTGGLRQFVWFDRAGNDKGRVGGLDPSDPHSPMLSPDGRRLAMERTINRNTDVWVLDVERAFYSRFTFDAAADLSPLWSPDGSRIVFISNRTGPFDLYEKSVDGDASERLLLATPQNKSGMDWSSDGRFLLYRSPAPTTGFDLWALPMTGDVRKPFAVVQTNFDERDGQFSPDGHWIAYQTNESGHTEIVIQPFPGPGGKHQISTGGGTQVRWRPDGRELFYVSADGRLMSVPIRLSPDGKSADPGAPVPLFVARNAVAPGLYRQSYSVSPDGQRFLMLTVEQTASPIAVILNWKGKPSA